MLCLSMVIERKSINGFSFPGLYYDDDVNIVLRSEESFFFLLRNLNETIKNLYKNYKFFDLLDVG
jgi:hypothetical protein